MECKTSLRHLPAEIRLQILEALLQDGCSPASLATVSRDWQTTVERHNFARIRLTPSRIPDFGSIVNRRRAFVRYIWVCLELGKYDRPYRNSIAETLSRDHVLNNAIIIAALDDLFSALSKWKPQGDLLLDISTYSPSDSEYWFKELTFVPDFPSSEECERALSSTAKAKSSRIANDEEFGWTRAPPNIAIGVAFTRVLNGQPLETIKKNVDWWKRLPAAPAVTGLLLRQQNRRRWDPCNFALLRERLPGVRDVHFEPWREWSDHNQERVDNGFRCLFTYPSYKNVERLVLFENFDQRYISSLAHWQCSYYRIPHSSVSRALARASRGLKHLSGAFIVEAGDFFSSAYQNPNGWEWPKLASLALTSMALAPHIPSHKIRDLLLIAANAAKRMPSLETMEIWFGIAGLAGMFRYRSARGGRIASITWRGTWDLELEEDVVRAWEAVANMERRAGLVVVKDELLDASKIRFHGDAIHYLGLEAEVVRPVSLYQMRMERDIRPGSA